MLLNFFKKPTFSEYLTLREELEGNYRETDILAKKHIELSKAVELSINQPTFEEISRKYDSFNKSYLFSLKQLNEKRRYLTSKLQKMNESVIKKQIRDYINGEELNKAISNFQKSSIDFDAFSSIYKSITKSEKIKYADIILRNTKGQILILQRSSTDKSNSMKWGIPGGHVDYGEDCLDAAKRELFEETGIKKDYLDLIGEYEDDKVHIKYYLGYCHEESPNILLDNDEHHDYKWIDSYTELNDYEMPFNMKENLNQIINPFQKQIKKLKKALDDDLISFNTYHSLINTMINKKAEIINKALGDDLKLQIEDYIMNHEGDFNDDQIHKYAEEIGVDYKEMEEYIFSIAKKYLEKNERR